MHNNSPEDLSKRHFLRVKRNHSWQIPMLLLAVKSSYNSYCLALSGIKDSTHRNTNKSRQPAEWRNPKLMVTEALWKCGGSTENLNSISQRICKKWSQQNEYQLECSHKSPFSNMWSLSIQSHWEKITTIKLSYSFRRELVKMLQGHLWVSEGWEPWWDLWFGAYL